MREKLKRVSTFLSEHFEGTPSPDRPSFWHRPIRLDRLCLFRRALGVVLVFESLLRIPHARETLSSDGWHVGYYAWMAPSPFFTYVLCLLALGLSTSVTVGYRSRVCFAVLAPLWYFLTLHYLVDSKAVSILAILCMMTLVFVDCDARFSLDDSRRKKAGEKRADAVGCIFPLRVLQIFFLQMYFFAGVTKVCIPDWPNGNIPSLSLQGRYATELGVWVSGWMPFWMARAAGLGTTLFEILIGPFLLMPSTRFAAIVGAAFFHITIESMYNVQSLGGYFLLAVLTLFPGEKALRLHNLSTNKPRSRLKAAS